ncbi:unnamed protein product [Pylaiella littoralis]
MLVLAVGLAGRGGGRVGMEKAASLSFVGVCVCVYTSSVGLDAARAFPAVIEIEPIALFLPDDADFCLHKERRLCARRNRYQSNRRRRCCCCCSQRKNNVLHVFFRFFVSPSTPSVPSPRGQPITSGGFGF